MSGAEMGQEVSLFALMEVAQEQQAAVQAALEGLAVERAALRKEREELARQVRTLERSTDTAVREAVRASLAGAATEGTAAVQAATQPLLGRLASVTQDVGRAQAAMREVVLWASWRLLGWIMALAAGLVLLGWLASTAVLWWDTGTVAAAQERKAALQAEVVQMQANRDGWVNAGMLGKLERCGPKSRPCVRVDENAGPFGERSDYRVILGY